MKKAPPKHPPTEETTMLSVWVSKTLIRELDAATEDLDALAGFRDARISRNDAAEDG